MDTKGDSHKRQIKAQVLLLWNQASCKALWELQLQAQLGNLSYRGTLGRPSSQEEQVG